jgi:hypothetical protein
MNWVKMGFDLIREVVAASNSEPAESPQPQQQPTDISGILARHRAEIDRNFESVVQMLNAQNDRHLQTIKLQKKWNYGLTAAVVVLAIGLVVSLIR